MSNGLDILSLKEEDVTKLLAASTHLGSSNCDVQMEAYLFKRKTDGTCIINLRKTWEKLLLAARAIAAIENPADVCAISARPYGQRAVLKFASHTGATPVAGRFTPGTFTNQIQAAFREPRLLVVTDPRIDHQPVKEASYVNIPVIAFCNTDSPLRFVDIAIPCNNKSDHSIGLMWWMLCREVLRLRGSIDSAQPWEIMPDLFFYRDPEEVEKMEQEAANLAAEAAAAEAPVPSFMAEAGGATDDWGEAAPVAATGPAFTAPAATDDWGQGGADDWGASQAPVQTAQDWGGMGHTGGETWT